MNYTRCDFILSNSIDAYFDVLASLLGDIGFDSFECNEGVLSAYISTSKYDESKIISVISSFPISGVKIKFKSSILEHHDWNEAWETTFSPIRIDNLAYIHSSAYPKCDEVLHDIVINPRMAFGSGSHSTTRLVLRMLLANDIHGKSVLDLGCGTGILGIAASLNGCDTLTSMDIDPDSIANTRYNMHLNGINSFKIIEGSIENLPDSACFDIILSNIHLNVHINLINEYFHHLSDKGELYLSGFYTKNAGTILSLSEKIGFKYQELQEEDGWAALKLLV